MKYRIYDKKEKEYCEWLLLTQDGRVVENHYGDLIGFHDGENRFCVELGSPFKDKNGKEIYEDDYLDDGLNKWIVERRDGEFFINALDYAKVKPIKSVIIENFEIIGNSCDSEEEVLS